MSRRPSRDPVILAVVLGVYFGLGRVGLVAAGLYDPAAAMWPASGFALAAMILLGRGVWPAILAAAFLDQTVTSGQIASSLQIALGNTLEAVLGAALVDRLAGGRHALGRADSAFRFLAVAALVSTPISAMFGTAAMMFSDQAPWADAAYLWLTRWFAHLCGILVVAPFILSWATTAISLGRVMSMLEGLALLGMIVGTGLMVFAGWFPSDVQTYPLEFLCVPLLLWTAFRFGHREMATAILLLSGIAAWGTLQGFGPFARDSPSEALVLVQAYTSVMATTGLVLAAAVGERRAAEDQLREFATTDSLTGLANYRRLLDVLRAEIARSRRTDRPFAVLLADMNGLKRINDRLGHLAGSRALVRVAEVLRQSTRAIDTPARFGGDEFAIVLPETGEDGGLIVLKRVSERLAADTRKPPVSISGGVAVFPRDGDSPTLLLRSADKALYDAKSRSAAERKAADRRTRPAKAGTLF